jgi:hypothetical protein
MKINCIVSSISFVLALASCKSTVESIPPNDLLPLKEGNEWIYETKIYDDSGTVIKISIDTLRIGYDLKVNGRVWHKLVQTNLLASGEFFENRSNGLWTFDSSNQKALLTYQFPSSAGFSYIVEEIDTDYNSKSWSHSKITDSIVAISEKVAVLAGNFNCYHYILNFDYEDRNDDVIDATFFSKNIYFCPNIGIIKVTVPMSVYDGNPKGFYMTSELTKYTLK